MDQKKLVFISHITEERELAMILSTEIKKSFLGMLDTFVSSDGASLPAGSRWLDKIDAALNQSAIQISLCSPQSIGRPWINFEAGAAWIRKIPVVPLCHSGLKKGNLPIPLAMLQAADIDNQTDLHAVFNQLSKTLGATTPEIDYAGMMKKIAAFELNYTCIAKIKQAINSILQVCPALQVLFISGQIQSQAVQIKNFEYNDIVRHLEYLSEEGLISYAFNQMQINDIGTFKSRNIMAAGKYLDDVARFL